MADSDSTSRSSCPLVDDLSGGFNVVASTLPGCGGCRRSALSLLPGVAAAWRGTVGALRPDAPAHPWPLVRRRALAWRYRTAPDAAPPPDPGRSVRKLAGSALPATRCSGGCGRVGGGSPSSLPRFALPSTWPACPPSPQRGRPADAGVMSNVRRRQPGGAPRDGRRRCSRRPASRRRADPLHAARRSRRASRRWRSKRGLPRKFPHRGLVVYAASGGSTTSRPPTGSIFEVRTTSFVDPQHRWLEPSQSRARGGSARGRRTSRPSNRAAQPPRLRHVVSTRSAGGVSMRRELGTASTVAGVGC